MSNESPNFNSEKKCYNNGRGTWAKDLLSIWFTIYLARMYRLTIIFAQESVKNWGNTSSGAHKANTVTFSCKREWWLCDLECNLARGGSIEVHLAFTYSIVLIEHSWSGDALPKLTTFFPRKEEIRNGPSYTIPCAVWHLCWAATRADKSPYWSTKLDLKT